MTTTVTAALLAVRQSAGQRTHLVASSPALQGASPTQTPMVALCGEAAGPPDPSVAVWDVDCGECVQLVGPYLCMPGWTTP